MSKQYHREIPAPTVKLGFVPLLDAAPLILARELGFFQDEGIQVRLHRESSWASLRDRLAVGLLDGAHMLGPMALAANLGLSTPVSLIAPLVLSRNGNAITASQPLHDALVATGYDLSRPRQAAQALAMHVRERADPIRVGIVYAWSTHYLQLRDWLASANLNPGQDIQLTTVPPTQMLSALQEDRIDMACVGEPWNSLAEQHGVGQILVTGSQIWQNAPEKVLGLRKDWADDNPDTLQPLLKGVIRACRWLDDPDHRARALDILSLPPYLDQALAPFEGQGNRLFHPRVQQHFFRQCANFPWLSQAQWLFSRMQVWGQISPTCPTPDLEALYRPDLYREAAYALGLDAPVVNTKTEGDHEAPFTVDGRDGPIQVASDGLLTDGRT